MSGENHEKIRNLIVLILLPKKMHMNDHSQTAYLRAYDENRDLTIFKNTHDDPQIGQPKKFGIERTHPNALKVLYFVHIEVRDMANPP